MVDKKGNKKGKSLFSRSRTIKNVSPRLIANREYNKTEARKLSRRRWQQSHREEYNTYQRKYHQKHKIDQKIATKEWRKRNRYSLRLRERSRWHIRSGKVLKEPCAICKSMENLIAIPQNPREPRCILFLCREHFLEWRRNRKNASMP